MNVNTSRFGNMEVDENSVITMPKGLIGFEDCTKYVLIEHRADTDFRWLQSIDEPGLAVVVVDPSKFYKEYEVEISDADAEKLSLTCEADATVMVIVSICNGGKDITANMAAPVVINSQQLVGAQIILQDSRYPVRHPLVAFVEQTCEEKVTVKAA
jgi:flagellar assembly factor FliW